MCTCVSNKLEMSSSVFLIYCKLYHLFGCSFLKPSLPVSSKIPISHSRLDEAVAYKVVQHDYLGQSWMYLSYSCLSQIMFKFGLKFTAKSEQRPCLNSYEQLVNIIMMIALGYFESPVYTAD